MSAAEDKTLESYIQHCGKAAGDSYARWMCTGDASDMTASREWYSSAQIAKSLRSPAQLTDMAIKKASA